MVSYNIIHLAVVVLIVQIAVSDAGEKSIDEKISAQLPSLIVTPKADGTECKPDPNCVKGPCKCAHSGSPKKGSTSPRSGSPTSKNGDSKRTGSPGKTRQNAAEVPATPRKGNKSPPKARSRSNSPKKVPSPRATSPLKKANEEREASLPIVAQKTCCSGKHDHSETKNVNTNDNEGRNSPPKEAPKKCCGHDHSEAKNNNINSKAPNSPPKDAPKKKCCGHDH